MQKNMDNFIDLDSMLIFLSKYKGICDELSV